MQGLYLIVCTRNKKSYVGRSEDIDKRIRSHFYTLRKGIHQNVNLQRDYDKYGPDAFETKRMKLRTLRECMEAEQYHLDSGKHKYNIGKSNTCGDNLTDHPDREEIIARRSQSFKATVAKMTREERVEKYGKFGSKNGMYGYEHSDEAKASISRANKGNSYAKGAKRSDEHKAKLSAVASTRTGEKNPFYGKSHSEETRKKIQEANKGRLPPNTLKVRVGKKVYESATAAAKDLGCAVASIRNRIENPKFPDYSYVS
mgnify:CR=1 FL=1|jgi:group I intron endonuclease|uniref:Intron associated endonuclease n=1 Tax=Myoviridae sp. ctshb19 TaxID=2825194 RepID=A0A8S5UG76_9CAUD|nr:MAG TPA: intron associated endonuclease [Myoviridae sp. ctshb19]